MHNAYIKVKRLNPLEMSNMAKNPKIVLGKIVEYPAIETVMSVSTGEEIFLGKPVLETKLGTRWNLCLWGDQATSVKLGDTVKIENGYVVDFNGTETLRLSKFSKLTVVEQ